MKGRTVGQLARYLRRNTNAGLDYKGSVIAALGHFKASGNEKKLLGSRLTYDYANGRLK